MCRLMECRSVNLFLAASAVCPRRRELSVAAATAPGRTADVRSTAGPTRFPFRFGLGKGLGKKMVVSRCGLQSAVHGIAAAVVRVTCKMDFDRFDSDFSVVRRGPIRLS